MSQIILSKLGQLNKSILPNVLARLATTNHHLPVASASFGLYQRQTPKSLYTDASLGMEKLDILKQTRTKLYGDGKDRYIQRLSQFLNEGQMSSIFKDDLINMIAFAETTEHLDIIEQIASTFKDDIGHIGAWGSAVVRLYCRMNEIDRAYENLKNVEKFADFFNQRISYQVVMSMLFRAGRYKDLIEIYELSTSRLNTIEESYRNLSDRRLTVLAFAAYAKMNTQEALEAASKLYAKDPNNPHLKARTISMMAYLAANLNQPVVALNLLSDHPHKNYVTAREIKTICLLNLKRYEDVLYHLRECLSTTRRDVKLIMQQTYNMLMNSISEIEDEQIKNDLLRTLTDLKEEQLVGEANLEEIVFKEIDRRPQEPGTQGDDSVHQDRGFNNRQQPGRRFPNQRQTASIKRW